MSAFWGPLLAGLVIVAVSGAGWLAYNHPVGYRRILGAITPAGAAVLGLWIGSIAAGITVNSRLLVENYREDPERAPSSHLIESLDWFSLNALVYLAIGLAVGAYLVFLRYLPSILSADDEDAPTE